MMEYDGTWFIGKEGTSEWIAAIKSKKEALFALGYHDVSPIIPEIIFFLPNHEMLHILYRVWELLIIVAKH